MFYFIKQILFCCGCIEVTSENKSSNLYNDKYQYHPEGNRFIYNQDL